MNLNELLNLSFPHVIKETGMNSLQGKDPIHAYHISVHTFYHRGSVHMKKD